MGLPALIYIVWDIYFTSKGIWSFNERYITGHKLYDLPIEEVAFFFVVPYCCTFIYECVKVYFPAILQKNSGDSVLLALSIILLVTGIIFHNKSYTGVTFISTSAMIFLVLFLKKKQLKFHSSLFIISYAIVLIPFLIVNGFLTYLPVVIYDNAQNLALRLYTIPVEDIFYGMLLVLMNIFIYENVNDI